MADKRMLEIMRLVVLDDIYTAEHRKYALSIIEDAHTPKEDIEAAIRMVADNGLQVGNKTVYGFTVRSAANFLEKGQKIYAIKVLRAETGLGLRECKDAVDTLAFRCGFDPHFFVR